MLMKDALNGPAVERISQGIAAVYPAFDAASFQRLALTGIEDLELKARVQHLIAALHQHLPKKYSETAEIFKKLPAVWPRGDANDALRGFAAWPIIDYVAVHGLATPVLSLQVLEKLTPLFSAEFAIRPFLLSHQEQCFAFFEKWVAHKDAHVRRLVSEGCRPRLPWGLQLKPYVENPQPILPWLEALRRDESQYVRRSVANNLNDIGKDHPQLLLDICRRWQAEDQGASDWIIRHATRSLVKAGHPGVFGVLGYSALPKVKIEKFALGNSRVTLGDALEFSLVLTSEQQSQKCVIDFAVHYQKANGKTAPKVYKLKNIELQKNERLSLHKTISFKKISTRRHYPGEHVLAIHINGIEQVRKTFFVDEAALLIPYDSD